MSCDLFGFLILVLMLLKWDLTICVSAAECVVFVLVIDFYLHYFEPAPVCKEDPLPGSAQWRWGMNIHFTTDTEIVGFFFS